MREGLIKKSNLISEYKKNIEIAIKEVEKLLKELEGQTVITSDHGNLYGKHLMFGHPPKMRFKELVTVPWLRIPRKD
ncbi:hypothetical protein AKJ55_01005 [candidate division MSBL1 archaeon SCGC-AAA382M17]|uniref:Metalloenzyme domain-containing protein n=1 Tax=candidate division MSBL1 archaeon SCGC-AAA382M17 TaxID=1698284 RepID=A0ABR5TM89_9EURY|nr:hypothetical protein AKJ55_01005 [candidate division MSBL1 archaeon SCGC-AAA382M17]